MKSNHEMMAVCGIQCGSCHIRRMPFNEDSEKIVIDWFRKEGWITEDEGKEEIIERKMYCMGCHGDREIHWSSDCWILHCCVDEKGLEHCNQCQEFPCERLVEWSGQSSKYSDALNKLKGLTNQ